MYKNLQSQKEKKTLQSLQTYYLDAFMYLSTFCLGKSLVVAQKMFFSLEQMYS